MTDKTVISPKLAKRNLKLQAWIYFLSGVVFLIPIITLLYKYTGLSVVDIVIISNFATITIWLFELPTAVFADTMGRKFSLVISMISNLLSALAILFFPSFIGFIVAAIFSGFYVSFWSGVFIILVNIIWGRKILKL